MDFNSFKTRRSLIIYISLITIVVSIMASSCDTESEEPDTPTVPEFKYKTYTVNGVSFDMVSVVGGTFTMGATTEQGSDADDYEKPTHKVTLSDYMIAKTEVTQELWRAVMGSNPSHFKGNLQCPVENVSWLDCRRFIKKLNALTGYNFRLPTTIEWTYVARTGDSIEYESVAMLPAWYNEEDSCKTQPVKTKQPNALGLYGVYGNAMEWTQDKYIMNFCKGSILYTSMKYYFYKRYLYWSSFKIEMHRYHSTGLRLAL